MQQDTLPQQFLERVRQITPQEKLDDVLSSFAIKKPISFRTNRLKIDTPTLEHTLQEADIRYEKMSLTPDSFILQDEKENLTKTNVYRNGFIYIQNLSSMIPVLLLDPKPNEHILDIAAAPGSKTTMIASIMGNTGEIIANEKSRERLFKLHSLLKQQGVRNTKTVHMPGEILWKKYPEYFDKALVDVPCTMEGRFSLDDPKSYADWSLKKIKMLTQTQRYLLRSAVSSTKVGGIIVYSTCTLAPEENEGVIDWLLRIDKDAVDLEEISFGKNSVNVPIIDGLRSWKKNQFDSRLEKTKRILPSRVMEGFFVARIRKVRSTISG